MPSASPVLLRSADACQPESTRRGRRHVRVRPGVYVERRVWEVLAPWERYAQQVRAVALARPDVVFSLESAAVLHGLPLVGPPRYVHVLAGPGGTSRRRGDVFEHTGAADPAFDVVDGIKVTTIAQTALAVARVAAPAQGVAMMDAALRRLGGATALDDLRIALESDPGSRGIRRARWVLDAADPASESVGESVSRVRIAGLGYATPVLQQVFDSGGIVDRADFFWPDACVIGEFDGAQKYGAGTARDDVLREKTRENRLRRRVRGFARWDWQDVVHVEPLDAILRDAGLRPVRPRRPALLTGLGGAAE